MTRFAALRLVWTAPLFFCATDAFACTCADRTLETLYESSPNVFMAVVVGSYTEPADKRKPLRSTFTITETFKGKPPFAALATPAAVDPSGDDCGVALEVGSEYLFFVPDSGAVEPCSGTVRRDHAGWAIAALRSFVWGASPDLAQPWYFYGPSQDGCSLATTFDIAENYGPGRLVISRSKTRATQAAGFDVTELSIEPGRGIPNGRDRNPRPLTLTVNDATYYAAWTTERVLRLPAGAFPQTHKVPDSYVLAGNDVEALLSELTMSRALRVRYDANGFGPSLDLEVRTTNISDAGVRMLDCMKSHQAR